MAKQLFRVALKCPKCALSGDGYLQGAALMNRTVKALEKRVQDRIAGVIMTVIRVIKNKQDGGRIKDFLKSSRPSAIKTMVFVVVLHG